MPHALLTDVLDVYEYRLALETRLEIALGTGDQLEQRRVEALISDHDQRHGTPAAA
ncbi:hypothetical protein [Streptomyces pacificus]|uniref:Uncharacterized protein n=1 Tax=Streptomyces pacificus TaxID=2705029 RepID=A0A6A0APA5_9ACTN|nr:hypothetical protein [Streptomyces pacificus]GFH34315.1 hypothetical protein SCWH03_05290 [Streptomyces pacificus]